MSTMSHGEVTALIIVIAVIATSLGRHWGKKDGFQEASQYFFDGWLRQCLSCGRRHADYVENSCEANSLNLKNLRDKFQEMRKDGFIK